MYDTERIASAPYYVVRMVMRSNRHSQCEGSTAKAELAPNGVSAPSVARSALTAPEVPQLEEPAVSRRRSQTMRNVAEPIALGEFTSHIYVSGAANRAYKLYVPVLGSARPRPLLMMLRGGFRQGEASLEVCPREH